MAYATDTRNFGASLSERITGLRASLSDRYTKYKVYRATLSELGALSERDLSDLGLHRSAIRSIAQDAAYKS